MSAILMATMEHWFAIRTAPRWEIRASSELQLRGVETYLPLCGVRRMWSDRIKVVQQPLFPGYLFSRFHLENRIRVLQAPGIRQIVASGDNPSAMEDDEIENLKILVAATPVIVPWPYLATGQRVRIERGPLAGLEGFVVRAEAGALRIVVSVDLLQRSVATEIDRDSLDLTSYARGLG